MQNHAFWAFNEGDDILNNNLGALSSKFGNAGGCTLRCAADLAQILACMRDFQGIKDKTMQQILEIAQVRQYPKNSVICYKNDGIDRILYLLHGSIKAYRINKYGKEVVFNLYISDCALKSAPPLINYGALISKKSLNNLATLEFCKILAIAVDDFRALLKTDAALANNILEHANRVVLEQNYLMELSLLDAKDKVVSLLKHYPNILDSVSKKLISSLLNISQETLSRALQDIDISENLQGF